MLILFHTSAYGFNILLAMYMGRRIPGNVINLIYSLNVVLLLIAQYTVLSSIMPGHRNWIEGLGVGLVLAGSSLGTLKEIWKEYTTSLNSDKE